MRKIKVAQIGISANSHGWHIFKSIANQNDIFEIVGYALPENEKEKFPNQVKIFKNYREMTVEEILCNDEIEAVFVETEEIYLTKYALMVAEAGKHLHMEKPGGTKLTDFEKLISVLKERNSVFSTGYMYRHNPYVKEILNKVKNGEIGEVISVEAQMNCIHNKQTREWLNTFPGGMMFFLGCHLIDLILQIQGKPEKIIPLNKSTNQDTSAEDFGMVILEYKNGVSFAKTSALEIGGFARRQLVVTGTKGTIELKPFEMYEPDGSLYTIKTEYSSNEWHNLGETVKSDYFDRYEDMLKAFAQYIRGEKSNPYTCDYELELYKTILKCCGVQ